MFRKRNFFSSLIVVALAFFLNEGVAQQEDRGRLEMKLKLIEEQIAKNIADLDKNQRQKSLIDRELKEISEETKKVEEASKKITAELTTLEESGKVLRSAVKRVEKEVEYRKFSLENRLITIYQLNRRHAVLSYLFKSSDSKELIRRVRYTKAITDSDVEKMLTLKKLVGSLHEDRLALTTAQSKQQFVLKKLEKISTELDRKKIKRKQLAEDVSKQELKLETAIDSLKSTSQDLEKILASMMGALEQDRLLAKKFSGAGLAESKGLLVYPVSGMVEGRFGKVQHDEFDDVLLRKGMEFRVQQGSPVKVVAPGKVVMNRVLSKYGMVVIVDHGKRFYTLYGRMAQVKVSRGSLVAEGDILGQVGADNFYFELRHKGRAIDPELYLR